MIRCGSFRHGWTCTLAAGHIGPHAARSVLNGVVTKHWRNPLAGLFGSPPDPDAWFADVLAERSAA